MVTRAQYNFNTIMNGAVQGMGIAGQFGVDCSGASNYINSIWSFGNMAATDDPEEAQASYISFLMSAFNVLCSFMGREAQAVKDIDFTKTNIDKGVKAAEAIESLAEGDIKDLLTKVKESTDEIEKLVAELEKIEEDEDIEAQKQNITANKDLIDSSVETINDENASDEEKKSAIETIGAACISINESAKSIQEIVGEKIADLTTQVETLTMNIETNMAQVETKIAESLSQIEAVKVETEGTTITKVTISEAKGGKEQVEAVAFQSAAAAATASIVGSGAAPELEKQAIDAGSASVTHIGGATKNLADLGVALKKQGGEIAKIGEIATAAGTVGEYAVFVIGEFAVKALGKTEGVGTWTPDIQTKTTALGSQVAAYMSILGSATQNNYDENSKQEALEAAGFDGETLELDTSYLENLDIFAIKAKE